MISRFRARFHAVVSDESARKMAGGAFFALLIKVGSAGLTFLMFVLLARVMPGGEEYGRFASAFSLAMFLGLSTTLGQPKLVLRFLSRYVGNDDAVNARAVVRFTLHRVAKTASMVALACAAITFILYLSDIIEGVAVGACVGLLTLGNALSRYYSHLLRALSSVVAALAPRDVLWRGAIVAFAGLGILQGIQFDAAQVLMFCAVSLVITIAVQVWIARCQLRRQLANRGEGLAADDDALREWTRATPGLAALLVMGEAFAHSFVVVTGLVLTTAEAGPFFAALKTAALLSMPQFAATMITAPMISRHYHNDTVAKVQSVCRMAVALAAPATLVGLTILILFGRQILGLFDPAFGSAYPALVIIAFGRLVNTLCGPTGSLMMMTGHERQFLAYLSVSNVSGLAVLGALAPALGLTGAAIGVTIAQCAWNISAWLWARRTLGIDPTALALVRRFIPASSRPPAL